MDDVRWSAECGHYNTSDVMQDYIENDNALDITFLDGSYAEGVNLAGDKYAIHAAFDGDECNFVVSFELLTTNTTEDK